MLDDLKIIAQRDKGDTIGFAGKQLHQLETDFSLDIEQQDFKHIVYAGMGGSALYADFVRSWPGVKLPYQIIRGYEIPSYVSSDTLFIASSYSGNTEETIACLEQAEECGATIVIIASGGKLQQIAEAKGYPFAKLDSAIPQPRMGAFAGFKALVSVLDAAGVCNEQAPLMKESARALSDVPQQWAVDVPSANNQAKQIAQELMGRSIVVYSGPLLAPVAYKWKISFNENAKNVSWLNQYPELNHNEFIGWTSHPVDKPYAIINLTSPLEHERVQRRFEASDRLLSGQRPHPITVEVQGETRLEQIIWGTLLGDFVSLYLAILNGVDPEPVALVEKLKQELTKE